MSVLRVTSFDVKSCRDSLALIGVLKKIKKLWSYGKKGQVSKVVQGPVFSTDQRHRKKKVVQLTEVCSEEAACASLLSNRQSN